MDHVNVRAGLKVWDRQIEIEMTLPAGPARLGSLLPVFQRIADGLVDVAVERAGAGGRTVSCRKGCGACCRQVVPVSEVEARAVGRLVDELPEPRREEIRARFARARERLAEAGLLAKLEEREGFADGDVHAFGLEYFHLGIPCPFLEDESCSIHADRPVSCREYLVTSPAANCADPKAGVIDQVEMPGRVWAALGRAGSAGPPKRHTPWVPLVLAPDWAATHPDESEPRPVAEVFGRVLDELARPKGPDDARRGGPPEGDGLQLLGSKRF